jgi:hypothetical protein
MSNQHINIGHRFSASLDTFHSLFQLFLAEGHRPFDDPLWLVVAKVQGLESTLHPANTHVPSPISAIAD